MALAFLRSFNDPPCNDVASCGVSLAHGLGGFGVECALGK